LQGLSAFQSATHVQHKVQHAAERSIQCSVFSGKGHSPEPLQFASCGLLVPKPPWRGEKKALGSFRKF
jgi:hypothetical protein